MPKEFWKTANPHHMALEPEGRKNRHYDLSLTLQFIQKRAVSGITEDSRSTLPTLFTIRTDSPALSDVCFCTLRYWDKAFGSASLSGQVSFLHFEVELNLVFYFPTITSFLQLQFLFWFSNVIYKTTFISYSPKGNLIFWVLSDVVLSHLFMWYTGIPPFSLCCFSGMEVLSLCSTVS